MTSQCVRRFVRRRRGRLREADDHDPPRRLSDRRPGDLHSLRGGRARGPSAEAAAADVRRRASRLVDRRGRHLSAAGVHRGHVRRRGARRGGDPEYLRWSELQTLQESGRWDLQLHSGHGHTYIQYGPGADDTGPFYAYEKQGEDFAGWQQRVQSDIEWGSGCSPTTFGVPAAGVRASVRQLRTGRDERPDPGRAPVVADRTVRHRVHAGRQRAGRRRRAATRAHPGDAATTAASSTTSCSQGELNAPRSAACSG